MNDSTYVHGYSITEFQRLSDQANTLSYLLHHDSVFRPDGLVLEAGCGTGAQTVIVAPQNPQCNFVTFVVSFFASQGKGGSGLHADAICKKAREQTGSSRRKVRNASNMGYQGDNWEAVLLPFLFILELMIA